MDSIRSSGNLTETKLGFLNHASIPRPGNDETEHELPE